MENMVHIHFEDCSCSTWLTLSKLKITMFFFGAHKWKSTIFAFPLHAKWEPRTKRARFFLLCRITFAFVPYIFLYKSIDEQFKIKSIIFDFHIPNLDESKIIQYSKLKPRNNESIEMKQTHLLKWNSIDFTTLVKSRFSRTVSLSLVGLFSRVRKTKAMKIAAYYFKPNCDVGHWWNFVRTCVSSTQHLTRKLSCNPFQRQTNKLCVSFPKTLLSFKELGEVIA